MISAPIHKDYLPDVTAPDNESDYEHEDEEEDPGDAEEEYDELYQDNIHHSD